MKIKAYFQIPKATSKMMEKEMLSQNVSPTKKPDIDNIVKIVLDALNKLAYNDDTQVSILEIEKLYTDEEEKLYVEIEEY